MNKSESQDEKSPSALIDERIGELGDWRGETLARLRALIKQAVPDVVEEWKWRGVPVWYRDGMISFQGPVDVWNGVDWFRALVYVYDARTVMLDSPLYGSTLAVAPDGTLWLFEVVLPPVSDPEGAARALAYRSTDGGSSFSEPVTVFEDPGQSYAVAFGPDGTAYVVYTKVETRPLFRHLSPLSAR